MSELNYQAMLCASEAEVSILKQRNEELEEERQALFNDVGEMQVRTVELEAERDLLQRRLDTALRILSTDVTERELDLVEHSLRPRAILATPESKIRQPYSRQ